MDKSIYDLTPESVDPELEDLKLQLQKLNSHYFKLKQQREDQKNNLTRTQEAETLAILSQELEITKHEVEELKSELEKSIELTQELISVFRHDLPTNENNEETETSAIQSELDGELISDHHLQPTTHYSLEDLVNQIQESLHEDEKNENNNDEQSVSLSAEQFSKIDSEISKTIELIKADIDAHKTEPLRREQEKTNNVMFLSIILILIFITGLLIILLKGM